MSNAQKVVVEGFWSNVEKHEDIIHRCFMHLFQKYPDPDGTKNALNHLLTQLHRMQVLSGKNEYKPERYKQGNHDKGRQQHIYKWTEKILGDLYRQNKRQKIRFAPKGDVETITPSSYHDYNKKNNSSFVDPMSSEPTDHTKQKFGYFPTVDQMGSFGCENSATMAQDTSYECEELYHRIMDCAKSTLEKEAIKLRYEHELSITDVGSIIGCTPQNVNIILKRVRERCATRGLLPKNYNTVKARVRIAN